MTNDELVARWKTPGAADAGHPAGEVLPRAVRPIGGRALLLAGQPINGAQTSGDSWTLSPSPFTMDFSL
ncbi:hypothetical protein Cs7R123_01620 [Catellatospora sp. TT07R-123]|uniref:hypothetical protein n=1 Tax=Catellatospora sp. TT07R-123 TaxID=2733863 RepID=UPI001AFEBE26|nr:hypothetical protein [Catellatospora sp. TT07R-123]GHJ42820.1 hypothetical protein Cs7R123_01620 [Catellatospora sp. TT07R-123]